MCNGKRDKFHEVVLHGETLVFSPLRLLRAVAEVESGSTFRETCLATEVRKSFTKPTMLHGATPAETCFAAPLHPSFSLKFQRVTAALIRAVSFAKLVMMSSTPAKSAGGARYASQDPFIHSLNVPHNLDSNL